MDYIDRFKQLKYKFWILNLFQMIEIFAYQSVIVQMSIYIAQKDAPGGLQWDHTDKGLIFFLWAIVQRLTPVIFGPISDKKGYKYTILFSYIFIIIGYWLLATQREYVMFTLGAVVLGFGSGIFRPSLQSGVSESLGEGNHKFGWGVYTMLFNLAVLFAIPFSKYITQFGWEYLFLASALVTLINFFLTLMLLDDIDYKTPTEDTQIMSTLKSLMQPKVIYFIFIMSGFTIIYMQFYETLPNFIYDWVDTSSIVTQLALPEYLTLKTPLGNMISYEWLYGINTLLVVFLVSFFTWFLRKLKTSSSLTIGIAIASIGLMICGNSNTGYIFILGIIVYTVGEIITNPNFLNYLDEISSKYEKAKYLSFLNISFAIGLGGGSILGGELYNRFGDKAALASKYLQAHYGIDSPSGGSLEYMRESLELTDIQIRDLLWSQFHPYAFWYVFLGIGVLAVIGMLLYKRKYDAVISK